MILGTVNNKQLSQIESLAKQLLLTLSESEWEDTIMCEDLAVLALDARNEQRLRSQADALQEAHDASDRLNTWENEGGNVGGQSLYHPLVVYSPFIRVRSFRVNPVIRYSVFPKKLPPRVGSS